MCVLKICTNEATPFEYPQCVLSDYLPCNRALEGFYAKEGSHLFTRSYSCLIILFMKSIGGCKASSFFNYIFHSILIFQKVNQLGGF